MRARALDGLKWPGATRLPRPSPLSFVSDFAQPGLISTFQQLNEAHLPRIEAELTELATTRPITLVLPCYGADLHQPALTHIVRQLEGATFLREIIQLEWRGGG